MSILDSNQHKLILMAHQILAVTTNGGGQIEYYFTDPNVTIVSPPTRLKRADPGLATQGSAPKEMVYVSQPQTDTGGLV